MSGGKATTTEGEARVEIIAWNMSCLRLPVRAAVIVYTAAGSQQLAARRPAGSIVTSRSSGSSKQQAAISIRQPHQQVAGRKQGRQAATRQLTPLQ